MNQPRRHTHFTLIELLMVVVILLILAGMLMGVLRQSRESALRSSCVSNLRTLGLTLHTYATDFDSFFPNVNPSSLGSPTFGNWQPLGSEKYISGANDKLWACPSALTPLSTPNMSNYRYFGSGRTDDNTHASLLTIGYDASGNHPKNHWMNALFLDGHVEGAKPDGSRRVTYPISQTSNAVSAWNLNTY